jgi:hypothetical protein
MAARIGSPQIRRAYRFLIEAEQAGRLFTQEELALPVRGARRGIL